MSMREDVERLEADGGKSSVYGFEEKTLKELAAALAAAGEGATLLTRTGLRENGEDCQWLQVKNAEGETVAELDDSFTCPPWPEEFCL